MKIKFFSIALSLNVCLQASQVAQKEIALHQKQATPLELQMIKDATLENLTQEKLQEYLKQHADINAQDIFGDTALFWAAKNCKNEAAQFLIDAGARLDIQDIAGYTALISAAAHGNNKAVQLLIDAGARLDIQNNDGDTALMGAAARGKNKAVYLLIAAGADSTIRNAKEQNRTARDYARNKEIYDKAVAAGLAEWHKKQAEYHARQPQAKKFIEEEQQLIPHISDIITSYAYGPSPSDLPPSKSDEEEKSNGKKDLKTKHGA